jgi:hypothetical protein
MKFTTQYRLTVLFERDPVSSAKMRLHCTLKSGNGEYQCRSLLWKMGCGLAILKGLHVVDYREAVADFPKEVR